MSLSCRSPRREAARHPPRATNSNEGFWLPDTVIREHLGAIGPQGLFVYCLIGYACHANDYPSTIYLAEALSKQRSAVWKLLSSLYDRGLINDFDIEKIMESDNKHPLNDEQDT